MPIAVALAMTVAGAGGGAVISPNQTLMLEDIPVAQGGLAGSLAQVGQRIGTAIGLAAALSDGALLEFVLAEEALTLANSEFCATMLLLWRRETGGGGACERVSLILLSWTLGYGNLDIPRPGSFIASAPIVVGALGHLNERNSTAHHHASLPPGSEGPRG